MAAVNPYQVNPYDYAAPPARLEVVVPHDTNEFTTVCRAIYVGVGGHVAAVGLNGTAYLHKNVPSGSYIMGLFKRVNATNTTATDMLAVG